MGENMNSREVDKLRREVHAEVIEHIYSVEAGHNYRRFPDVARRKSALDRLGKMTSSASDRELKEIGGILTSYVRNQLHSYPIAYPTRQEIVDEFNLAKTRDELGRKPRQRATLHRIRNLWLSRARFRDGYASRALAILKHPDNQKIRACIAESENYYPQFDGNFALSDLRDANFSGFSLVAA